MVDTDVDGDVMANVGVDNERQVHAVETTEHAKSLRGTGAPPQSTTGGVGDALIVQGLEVLELDDENVLFEVVEDDVLFGVVEDDVLFDVVEVDKVFEGFEEDEYFDVVEDDELVDFVVQELLDITVDALRAATFRLSMMLGATEGPQMRVVLVRDKSPRQRQELTRRRIKVLVKRRTKCLDSRVATFKSVISGSRDWL